jgi:hypothetical protein
MSLVFLAVYLGARTIWLHNAVVSAFLVLAASLVKSAALLVVWILFVSIDGSWTAALRYIFLEALLAAALAPVFFTLLQRGQHLIESPLAGHE